MDRTRRLTGGVGVRRGVVVAKLSRDGYIVQVLIGTPTQTLIITGRRLTPSELLAIGKPPPATPQAQKKPA